VQVEVPGWLALPDWEYEPAAATRAVLALTAVVTRSPAAVARASISARLMSISPVNTTRSPASRGWAPWRAGRRVRSACRQGWSEPHGQARPALWRHSAGQTALRRSPGRPAKLLRARPTGGSRSAGRRPLRPGGQPAGTSCLPRQVSVVGVADRSLAHLTPVPRLVVRGRMRRAAGRQIAVIRVPQFMPVTKVSTVLGQAAGARGAAGWVQLPVAWQTLPALAEPPSEGS
jgi:hypothetical protein